jgi:preprotein translocase subunit SecY
MEASFFTLQDFMAFTKSVTYVLMVVSLVAFAAFWRFLSAAPREEAGQAEDLPPHGH